MNVVASTTAVVALISAIIAADARYTKVDDLDKAKNEIIDEMRTEVTKNRKVMITTMQREADDLEFAMMEYEQEGKQPPRYMVEKFKQITRQIDELKDCCKDDKDEND